MVAFSPTTLTGYMFQDPKNEKHYRVFQKNMNMESFTNTNTGMQTMMTLPEHALLNIIEILGATNQFKMCEVELIPWKENLGLASIGLQKSSPYLPFMKQIIVDIQENGILKNLNHRWLTRQPICKRSNTAQISPKKLILSAPGEARALVNLTFFFFFS